jgi:NAD(P)-dependent dehydrogenase (short-subunit alcohol dehydrogenase family)
VKIDHIEEIEALSRLALPEDKSKAHALTKAIVKAQEHRHEEAKDGQFGLLTTEQTVEHHHQVCDINIRGVLLSMKHEIAAMLRSGGAAIVNTSSAGGHIGFPGLSVYVASKFAVIGLTKTAAVEFARQGIRVNSVSPGPIQTEMFDRAFGEGETEVKKTISTQTPIGPIGTPEEEPASCQPVYPPGRARNSGAPPRGFGERAVARVRINYLSCEIL